MDRTTLDRPLADVLATLDPGDADAAHDHLGLAAITDHALVSACAAVIDRPKAAPPDSFVLHAPLELMARAGLLARVAPDARDAARRRLVRFAATYAAAGPSADEPPLPALLEAGRAEAVAVRPVSSGGDGVASTVVTGGPEVDGEPSVGSTSPPWSAAEATAGLAAAITAGDLDAAGAAARALAGVVGTEDLVAALVDLVAPSLAAAAHGGIYLNQLRSFAGTPAAPGVANMARELARHPDWRLTWFEGLDLAASAATRSADALVEALRRPASPGPLDVNFIHPTMHLTESSGLAAEVLAPALAGVERASASRALLRVAALSMLQDDPAEAPYGWSHCLTMPHGLLSVATLSSRPGDVLAVAATYVLAFRATQGAVDLDPHWAPAAPPVDTFAALDGPPDLAAAGAWHTIAGDRAEVASLLAGRAAAHEDAHLAKYTLACLQLADADPAFAHGFLAAAAFLGAWWRQADGVLD